MSERIPGTMTAIGISQPGGPEVLKPVELPVPKPGTGDVLIRVAGAGLNGADLTQRQGKYPMPPDAPDIPGLEASGTVVAVGDGVTRPHIGDAVCALIAGGGYAEYALAPAPQCLPIPDGLPLADAGALPEIYCTVWSNLFERGRLTRGETALIQGGTSGIGHTAIQLAKALGATVLATARTAEKCAACERFGADRAINYTTEDFLKAGQDFTGGRGVTRRDACGGRQARSPSPNNPRRISHRRRTTWSCRSAGCAPEPWWLSRRSRSGCPAAPCHRASQPRWHATQSPIQA